MGVGSDFRGEISGRYSILEQIGAGGMGVVFRARDEQLQRDVAIKILPSESLADNSARKRFRNEALLLARVVHPNVEVVHEFGTADQVSYLVTEFIPGISLDTKLAGGALRQEEVVELGIQLAAGLQAAHQKGVVHRDLKPANLRITPDGHLKILDFGLAHLSESEDASQALTITKIHEVSGTLPYMAPEQLRGEKTDLRTDIWGVGAVLYEMATGKRPFEAKVTTALAAEIVQKPPANPSQLNAKISPEMAAIILRCLEKDPDNRYQSAKDVGIELRRRAAAQTGVASAPPSHAKTSISRVRFLIGVLAVSVLLSITAYRLGWLDQVVHPPVTITSLAVLPFANLSHDAAQDYFSEGIADGLLTDLAQTGTVRVISRTSSIRYKDSGKSLSEIGRELHADAVVEGTVVRIGERIKVNVQLVSTSQDDHLWANSYERDVRDIVSLQHDLVQEISRAINVRLSGEQLARLKQATPVNSDAYDTYLKGRFHLVRENELDNQQAIELLENAVKEDPTFAPAYADLARAYTVRLSFFSPQESHLEEKAFVAAEKALALDPGLAEAHLARGLLLWTPSNHFPHEKAVEEYRRALVANPNLDDAHQQLAVIYLHIGLLDRAMEEAQTAVNLNPTNTLARYRIGAILHLQGKYQEALSVLNTIPKEFQSAIVTRQMAWTLFSIGKKDEARSLIADALKHDPKDEGGQYSSMEALFFAADGNRQQALQKIKAAEKGKGYGHFHHTAYNIAAAYALLNEPLLAIQWLKTAAADGYPCYPLFESDPSLSKLRNDHDFAQFMADERKEWEYYRSTLGRS